MLVRCNMNEIGLLGKKLSKMAFTQDNAGIVDLTIGKDYEVYGVRTNKLGKFYLVLTDRIHSTLPWWMPETFFEMRNSVVPETWAETSWRGYGKEIIIAHPAYFDAMEDVEDGTEKGHRVFSLMRKT